MPLQDRQILKIFLHDSGNHSKPVLMMDQFELDNWVFMGNLPDKHNMGAIYDKFLAGKYVQQVSPNTYSQKHQRFQIVLSNFTPDELKLFEEVWKERLAHFKKNPLKGKRIYRVTLTNTGSRPQATAESEITEKSGPFGDASLKPRNLLKSLEEILIHVPHDMVNLDFSDPLQITITGHKAFSDIVFEGFGPDEMIEMVEFVKSFFAMQKSSNPIADKYITLEDVERGKVIASADYDVLEFISGQKREGYLFDVLARRTAIGGHALPVIQKSPNKYASVGDFASNAILVNFEPDELLRIQEVFKQWLAKPKLFSKHTKKNPLLEKKITSQLYSDGGLAYTDEHTVFNEEGINLFYAAKTAGAKVGARQLLEAIAENKFAFDAKYSYFRPTDRPDQFNLSNKKTDGCYLIRFHGFSPNELRDLARWASKGLKKSRIDKGQGREEWVDESTGRGPGGSWRRNPLEAGYYTIIKEYRADKDGRVVESSTSRWDVRSDESAQVVVDAMNLGRGIERVEGMKIYLRGPMSKHWDAESSDAIGMYYVVDLAESNLDPDFIRDILEAAKILAKIHKEPNPLLDPVYRVIYQWRRADGRVEDEGVWAELSQSSVPRLFVDDEGQVAKLLSEFYGQLVDVEGRMLVFKGHKPLDSSKLQGTKIPVHRYYLVTLKDFDPFKAESFLQFARRALGKPMRNPIQEPYVIFKTPHNHKERKVTMSEVITLNNSKIAWASKKHTSYEEIIEFINYYGDVTGVEGLKVFFQTEMGTKYILDLAPLEDPALVNQVLSRLSWGPKKNPLEDPYIKVIRISRHSGKKKESARVTFDELAARFSKVNEFGLTQAEQIATYFARLYANYPPDSLQRVGTKLRYESDMDTIEYDFSPLGDPTLISEILDAYERIEYVDNDSVSFRSNPRYDDKSLKRGAEHELEHTTNLNVATKIATDHLLEDPEYYEKLDIAMEGNPVQDLPDGMSEDTYRKLTFHYLKYLAGWWHPHSEGEMPKAMRSKLEELAWLVAWAGYYGLETGYSFDSGISSISVHTESDPSVGMFASRVFEVLVDKKGKVTFVPSRDYESFMNTLDEDTDFMEAGSLNFRIEVEKDLPARFGGKWEAK